MHLEEKHKGLKSDTLVQKRCEGSFSDTSGNCI